jgi:ketosteroid isomerase-like protein
VTDSHDFIASVEEFLLATAERRLADSVEHLAEAVEFVYPNGTFHDLGEVFAAGERRYRWIRKRHVSWDVVDKGEGTTVVVSAGTLHGENNAGVPFDGVRYVDRITYRDGKIVRQEVWNDLAESGVLNAVPRGK